MNATARTLEPVVTNALGLPWPGPEGFTIADLHALPDDGLRYELVDGSIIVSPSATYGHNTIARWIANLMEDSSPNDDWVVSIDQSATVDDHNEPRPDIVVAKVEHFRTTPFPIQDTLMVGEVVSPSSVLRDTETKKALYAKAGVPAYWIVVPDEDKERITLAELRLDGGVYHFVEHFTADVFRTDFPWPVEIDLPAMSERWARRLRRAPR